MTPHQADHGLVELMLPNGGHVLVAFREEAAIDPAVEGSVVQVMLEATGTEREVLAAIADYAETSGFATKLTVDHGSLVVLIG